MILQNSSVLVVILPGLVCCIILFYTGNADDGTAEIYKNIKLDKFQ